MLHNFPPYFSHFLPATLRILLPNPSTPACCTYKKISSGLSTVKHIRYFVPRDTLLTVYRVLIQPHFNYCSVVWGNHNRGLSLKLQKLQNRPTRIITSSKYDVSLDELFQSLHWNKIEPQRKIDLSILMSKAPKNEIPEYLSSRFIKRIDVMSYKYIKRSFSYSGAVLWNSLLGHLRQASSLTSFKSQNPLPHFPTVS